MAELDPRFDTVVAGPPTTPGLYWVDRRSGKVGLGWELVEVKSILAGGRLDISTFPGVFPQFVVAAHVPVFVPSAAHFPCKPSLE